MRTGNCLPSQQACSQHRSVLQPSDLRKLGGFRNLLDFRVVEKETLGNLALAGKSSAGQGCLLPLPPARPLQTAWVLSFQAVEEGVKVRGVEPVAHTLQQVVGMDGSSKA